MKLHFGLLWVAAALTGCGSKSELGQVSGARETRFPEFAQLVYDRQFEEALAWACAEFDLDCTLVTVVKNLEGSYAVTNPYSNQITVDEGAFSFDSLEPDAGWLAAVIGHELIHTTQPFLTRQGAGALSRFGYDKATAAVEIPAWEHMRYHARLYRLTAAMKSEVTANIAYYESFLGE